MIYKKPINPIDNFITGGYEKTKLTGNIIKMITSSMLLYVIVFILKINGCGVFYFINYKHTMCTANMVDRC